MLFVPLIQAHLKTRSLGREIAYYPFTETTNADLWELVADGEAQLGQVVVTDDQRGGRGRQGREWFSAPNMGLPFSVLIEPQLPTEQLGLLSLAMGVAVVDALADEKVTAQLKWPNDVLAGGGPRPGLPVDETARANGGGKLGGILAESRTISGRLLIVMGAGLNVNEQPNDFPEALRDSAVSLRMLRGTPAQRELLLAGILNRLEALLGGELAKVATLWEERCAHLGETVRFHHTDRVVEGRFMGLDEAGRGRIDVGGKIQVLAAGDLEWSPA